MKIIGVVLIVLGICGLAYGGLSWTTREKVVDAGPIQISKDNERSLPVPPVAGAIMLVAGLLILVNGRSKS